MSSGSITLWLLGFLIIAVPYCCHSLSSSPPAAQQKQDLIGKNKMLVEVSPTTKATFRDKSVLLTGATGGLGVQLALQLAKCQVKTLILSGRSEKALQNVKDMCNDITQDNNNGIDIQLVPCDLSDRESVINLGQKSLSLCDGQIVDVLINCGGVSSRSNFIDTKLEIDEKVMQINFFAGAALAKAVVPGMVASGNGGKIIWISSVQGLVGIPSRTSYAASKFAVQGYCEALRAEVADNGITVHCISPGYIRTNLSKSALTGDGTAHGQMDKTTANGAEPNEVAVTILDKVAKGNIDFIVAATTSAKAAIWMRLLCPGILQKLLVKRFKKSEQEKEKID
jgi:dehydrogenase/reductase SDR family protein 7B